MAIKIPSSFMESANNEISSDEYTCRLCGEPITAEQEYRNPCLKCLRNEPETLLKRFDEIDRKALKRELRIDQNRKEYILKKDAGTQIGKSWSGYQIEIFGVYFGRFSKLDWSNFNETYSFLEENTSDEDIKRNIKQMRSLQKNNSAMLLPFPCVHIAENPDLIVQLCRIRVFYRDDKFYSEMKVHPLGVRRISVQGLERSQTKTDLEHVWKGLELLRMVDRDFGGRKKGSTKLSLQDFQRNVLEVYKNYVDTTGEAPKDLDIAYALHLSSATFRRYLKSSDWNMQKLRREAEKYMKGN